MIRAHVLWTVLPIVLALGCEQGGTGNAGAPDAGVPPATTGAATPTPTAPVAAPAAKARPVRGEMASGLFAAASTLPLNATQKESLDKANTARDAADDGVRTAMQAYRSDLAAGVKAGKLDTPKLNTEVGTLEKALADQRDKESSALDALHGTLDPGQRASLVSTVRATQAEHAQHVATWLSAQEGDGGAAVRDKARIDALTMELSLDPTQQKQVAAALARPSGPPAVPATKARWDELQKRQDAVLTAFEGATFDARKLDLSTLPDKTPRETMDRVTTFVGQLVTILHPPQRDTLAADLDHPFGARARAGAGPETLRIIDDIVFPFSEPGEAAADAGAAGEPAPGH